MKRFLVSFLVGFGMVCGLFLVESCSGRNLVWSTSNGIVTYNRLTGQFEFMWDAKSEHFKNATDTVYICPDDTTKWIKVNPVRK